MASASFSAVQPAMRAGAGTKYRIMTGAARYAGLLGLVGQPLCEPTESRIFAKTQAEPVTGSIEISRETCPN
jgi:hypothetical protein